MESNDEFQFRPITSGLGFHSNPNKNQNQNQNSANASTPESDRKVTASSVSRLISSLPTLDFNESDLKASTAPAQPAKLMHTPVGHSQANQQAHQQASLQATQKRAAQAQVSAVVPSAGIVGAPPVVPSIPGIPARDTRRMARAQTPTAKTPVAQNPAARKFSWSLPKIELSPAKKSAAVSIHTAAVKAARKPDSIVIDEIKYRETPVHISAALFDLLVVAGTTCIFAVALLLVTNTDLSLIVHNARSDWATRAGILLLLFSVHALYMVGSRAVAGCTLGEWAFDIQLGTPQQQSTAWYPLAICVRYVVTVLTGYVALPLLSLIMSRDVAANLCGLKLYQTVK